VVGGAALLTRNVYQRFLRPGRSEAHYLAAARIAGVLLTMFATLLAFKLTSLLTLIELMVDLPVAIGISFWLGIAWRRYTTAAVYVSSISVYLTFLVLELQSGVRLVQELFPSIVFVVKGKLEVHDAWQIVIYLSVGVISGMVTSLLTRPVPQAQLDHFFRLLRTPARHRDESLPPCMLPEGTVCPAENKLIRHPYWEIPKPSLVGIAGFVATWILTGLIVCLTWWLSRLGSGGA